MIGIRETIDFSTPVLLDQYCRLCLRKHLKLGANIFEKEINQDGEKVSLLHLLESLLGIKYEFLKWLPMGICQDCLSVVESFGKYRKDANDRESKLRNYVELKLQTKSMWASFENRPGLNGNPGEFVPDKECVVVVVNPDQMDDSSEDDFSMESDSENEQAIAQVTTNAELVSKRGSEPLHASKANVDYNQLGLDDSMLRNGIHDSNAAHTKTPIALLDAPLVGEYVKNTFLCQFCDLAYTTKSDCLEHESRHDAVAPYVCNTCMFKTQSRQALINHIKESHDSDRPYVCALPLCHKSFGRRSDLKKHAIVHTGVRPYTCGTCGKSFSRNANLTKHIRIHSSVKPHVCQHCPRSFGSAVELLRHAELHNDLKHTKQKVVFSNQLHSGNDPTQRSTNPPVKFSHAQQRSQTAMKAAQVKHNPRLFICTICTKSFARERDLQCHWALHQDELFSCSTCGLGFSRREKLARHEHDVHGVPRSQGWPSFGSVSTNGSQTKIVLPNIGLGFYSEAKSDL